MLNLTGNLERVMCRAGHRTEDLFGVLWRGKNWGVEGSSRDINIGVVNHLGLECAESYEN